MNTTEEQLEVVMYVRKLWEHRASTGTRHMWERGDLPAICPGTICTCCPLDIIPGISCCSSKAWQDARSEEEAKAAASAVLAKVKKLQTKLALDRAIEIWKKRADGQEVDDRCPLCKLFLYAHSEYVKDNTYSCTECPVYIYSNSSTKYCNNTPYGKWFREASQSFPSEIKTRAYAADELRFLERVRDAMNGTDSRQTIPMSTRYFVEQYKQLTDAIKRWSLPTTFPLECQPEDCSICAFARYSRYASWDKCRLSIGCDKDTEDGRKAAQEMIYELQKARGQLVDEFTQSVGQLYGPYDNNKAKFTTDITTLEFSTRTWESRAQGISHSGHCPLCVTYKICDDCPICIKDGANQCRNTPYYKWNSEYDPVDKKRLAAAMVDHLCGTVEWVASYSIAPKWSPEIEIEIFEAVEKMRSEFEAKFPDYKVNIVSVVSLREGTDTSEKFFGMHKVFSSVSELTKK